MSSQSDAASSPTTSVGKLNQIFKDFGALITTVVSVISGVVLFQNQILAFWDESTWLIRILAFSVVGLVTAFAIYAQIIAPWMERRRRQRVIDLIETDEPQTTEVFRLRPYEERDHEGFDRPDGAHRRAVDWLNESDALCLYLTGFSGTGKSSLLQAWLIPELAEAKRPMRTVVVRSFADPIGQLVEALKAKDALPVDLPEAETDPLVLLARAADAMAARNGRLLIAIDQFEECLILQDQATKDRLAELFAALRERPIEGLQLLFVMRTDYLDFDELAALSLPDPRPRENWFPLNALSHADARSILRQALPGMDRSLEDQVIEEASDVDDLPGLIRPITLNMMGLILRNFAGAALTRTAPGRLIQDFLRHAIEKPGIERAAPALLAEMITNKGTKRPMAETALAGATGIETAMTRKTLYLLAEEGVVRELDRGQNIWEISHDFVARQLGQIIPRLKPSWWQQAQKAATPVALVAWLVILGAGYPIYKTWQERHIFSLFQAEGVTIHGEPGAYKIVFNSANVGAVEKLFAHVRRLAPISLSISGNDQLQALPALDGLAKLESLVIRNNGKLQAVEGLDGLAKLESLEISWNDQLQALPALDGLAKLESLSISENGQLQALPALDGLAGLQSLEIRNNGQLQALPALDGLAGLQSLEIRNNGQLQALPALARNTNLNIVRITGNDMISGLPELGDLDRLEAVAFHAADIEASIEALKALPADITIETRHDVDEFSERLNQAREALGLKPAKVARWGSTRTQ